MIELTPLECEVAGLIGTIRRYRNAYDNFELSAEDYSKEASKYYKRACELAATGGLSNRRPLELELATFMGHLAANNIPLNIW